MKPTGEDFAAFAAGIRDEGTEVEAGRVEPRYVCVDCRRSMRIKPRDGFRCDRCLHPWPRVVCGGWKTASGAPMRCADPVMRKGDPGGEDIQGQCRVCAEMQRQADAQRAVRAMRRVYRKFAEPHEVTEMTDEDWRYVMRGQ